jgi:uncharacterized protein (DUF4415 family)
MSKKRVRRDVDLAHLPPLTEKQKAELYALAARLESDIDTSEIPPLTAKFCADAAPGRFYKPTKTSTTVRIDADVLAWLRAEGGREWPSLAGSAVDRTEAPCFRSREPVEGRSPPAAARFARP